MSHDELADFYPEVMIYPEFEEALVGITTSAGETRVVYHREKCIDCLVEGGMSQLDAEEYFAYNVDMAYLGEATPVILDTSLTDVTIL